MIYTVNRLAYGVIWVDDSRFDCESLEREPAPVWFGIDLALSASTVVSNLQYVVAKTLSIEFHHWSDSVDYDQSGFP